MNGVALPPHPLASENLPPDGLAAPDQTLRLDVCTGAAFAAGVLSPFAVNVVGQMPLGEVVLFGTAFYALLYIFMTHRWPNALLAGGLFWLFMGSQFIAFGGYVVSDLVRGSSAHDFERGWARMIFLAIDLVAMTYLAGRSRFSLVILIFGQAVGACAETLINGALFDDYWKFGYGSPITRFIMLGSAPFGLGVTQLTTAMMGCLHLVLDFRSLGAQCILVATILGMLRLRPQIRVWVMPLGIAIAVAASAAFYHLRQQDGSNRATRSNVERSAMMTAAWEAFVDSPVLGHGSWFSNTNVMDRFLDLRTENAKREGIGGFTTDEVEEGLTLHSQILVGLAEGGLAGGLFFTCYGLGLLWAIGYSAAFRPPDALSAIYLLTLCAALSNLFFSPFSGDHRIAIALAAGIVLQLWQEWRTARRGDREAAASAYHFSLPVARGSSSDL